MGNQKQKVWRIWSLGPPSHPWPGLARPLKINENPLWLLQYMFLINVLFKIDEHFLWGIPPSPVHISYSIYPIQSLFKIDLNPLWSLSLPPIHIPYSILIQN
jgi:hypothetical protein